MKSIKSICSFKASYWVGGLFFLLVAYAVSFQFSEKQVSVENSKSTLSLVSYFDVGYDIVFGHAPRVPGKMSVGKGQCPLCHTFEPGDNLGRCPNLFGVEERSRSRIKEDRYLNHPIKIGEIDKTSGIVKGRPDLIPEEYRRKGSPEMTGEDYLRESMMCPSCYIVKGYGKAGDTKSPEPMIHRAPISLNKFELNAVIAWLQIKDTPGDYSKVTVPLPTYEEMAVRDLAYKVRKQKEKRERALFLPVR